ncbi:S46 family peptidase [Sphingomicrobium sediminis]|uniref:Dipeptidyl-peptidase n=1 Tax=Sphingomicrobium sediminis TaxID=2950949 RepID=A0A9X2EI34_9SPHN|nr:S46 family peptidase [Sphingomicrobium sediminis]MCM8557945.1 S46 family peptidase [Sphingomicrobium sediminis]
MRTRSLLLAASAAILMSGGAKADEGMWTFDAFPRERMMAAYGWAPDQEWLDTVREGAVRLNGCSASFVSDNGLILTNHHCISSCLAAISNDDNDYLANGFNVATMEEEIVCPGQRADIVTSIADVTDEVKGAIAGLEGDEAVAAQRAITASLTGTDACTAEGYSCQVVSLYNGGQYSLYTYRRYDEVRIAWAPEAQAAQFGGDPDNFNFPRYSMDGAFLRAYENGEAAVTPNHLTWNPRSPQDGEITLVVGNPGSTQRLLTVAQLEYIRDVQLPRQIATLSELRGRLISAMDEDEERTREGNDTLGSIENSLKVQFGRQRALTNMDFFQTLIDAEEELKAEVAGNDEIGDPWTEIDEALDYARANNLRAVYDSPSGTLYGYAQTIVAANMEMAKPAEERDPGFGEATMGRIAAQLGQERTIHLWLDELLMEWSLSKAREYLGTDDPQTKTLLGDESPEGLSERLVRNTSLTDPAARVALLEGGLEALQASEDPMIQYALRLYPQVERIGDEFATNYSSKLTDPAARLADARFAAYGDSLYPDATFTLRINYGVVKSWEERGEMVPTTTTIAGTYDRATGNIPYDLPSQFIEKEDQIDKSTVYNFVSTNDIIGGNSGSPVLDRNGTVIGAAFDGNIYVTGGSFGYDAANNRMITVSTAALQEALEVIYPAPRIVAELAAD